MHQFLQSFFYMDNIMNDIKREELHCDVAIIGAGPSGLATAIKLAQLAKQHNKQLEICVLEKGSEVGAHILSGAVFEPDALTALIPDWQILNAPLKTLATKDEFIFLTKNNSYHLPVPSQMKNHGNYIISLSNLCKWLASYAERLGVQIFPGFPARAPLFDEKNEVIGVVTNDMGVDKNNKPKENFQPGIKLIAKYTVLAEGCRGSVTKEIIEKFQLQKDSSPQTYALGIKELWEIPKALHKAGLVTHTIGWPLDSKTYGGSFLYHLEPNLLAIGFVVGLDYENPYLNPFEELQRFKHHPKFKPLFMNSKRIAYGARTLVEGGIQSIPKLCFPGGIIVGDAAGFLNVPKIKGSHNAIKSGIIAAESLFEALENKRDLGVQQRAATGMTRDNELHSYTKKIKQSAIYKELQIVRNIRPAFNKWGIYGGMIYAALDTYIFRGKAPWTFSHKLDNKETKLAKDVTPIIYPKHDGVISFDKLTSVSLSGTMHEENQPVHLKLKDKDVAINVNFKLYNSPEQYYCPASVYEIVTPLNQKPYLQINFTNCVHCKACDIKDPTQNIVWTTPEGGGGPNYNNM